uniref:RAP domain-containing protein n=1 Tax=Mola mola TaxID=94237 RepID=A0A3Q4ATM3_MOLML
CGNVLRRGLLFCSRGSVLQQRAVPLTQSVKDFNLPRQQFSEIRGTRRSQTCLARNVVRPVRFYSQDRIHSEDRGEEEHRLSPLAAAAQLQSSSAFLERLRLCGSPSDVLDITCHYLPTVRQVSNCLTQMWSTTKKMSDEQRLHELRLMFDHPAFDRLLQDAMNGATRMRTDDIAYSLIAMVKLGVPHRSRVVQTYLRHCQGKLNDFDEKGLSILASCLAQIEDSPNAAALKEGMRLVVEARLPKIKNVLALQTMMRLLGKDAPLDLKRKLEGKALSMTDQFSLPNTQYMISTMATMGFYSKPLLDICSEKIKENIYGIPFNRLLTVLRSCRELHYRDLGLLTDISDYVASMIDIWSNKQLILFLSALENLAFYPATLIEAYAEKVITNPDALTLKDILCVLKVYSSLNYDVQHQRQQFLDSLSRAVDSYLPKMTGFELLKTIYHLCVLGHFPPAPLQQLLVALRFLHNQERMFQTVDLCLHLDRPPLPIPLTVPSCLLGDAAPASPPARPWLSQSLRRVLEDQADTMLQEICYLFNVDTVFSSFTRIAVIYAAHAFCYGTSHPRGPLAVKIRHLKILGYDGVLVLDQELLSMSEPKRAEFLRGCIFPEHHGSDTQAKTELLGS